MSTASGKHQILSLNIPLHGLRGTENHTYFLYIYSILYFDRKSATPDLPLLLHIMLNANWTEENTLQYLQPVKWIR